MLVHEMWLDPNEDGQMLPCLGLAGPMGDDFRKKLNPGAKLVRRLRASSPAEVMTEYWNLNGWGEYRSEFEEDYQPYPEEWVRIQTEFFKTQN